MKPHRGRKLAPLHPLPVPTRPWQVISWDLIGPLSDSARFDMILVIKDYFTKSVIIRPTQQELTAQGAATILLEHVYANYGLPEKIVSDRRGQFVSKFMQEVYRVLGIQTAASTAYHPQTDGHTEQANQEVEVLLQALIKEDQSDWAAMLPLVQFALNNRSIQTLDITPFCALHGYKPALIPELTLGEQVPEADKFLSDLWETREKLQKVLLEAQDKDKDTYDQHVCEPDYYKSGDLVYLDARNLPLCLSTPKLVPKSVRQFPMVKQV